MNTTNERAIEIRDGLYSGHAVWRNCDKTGRLRLITAGALAADLLEARELIKEMRNYFEIIRDNSLNPAHTMTLLGLENVVDANRSVALEMLEKSKEYVE